jgi:hypothetical protein
METFPEKMEDRDEMIRWQGGRINEKRVPDG